jgi:ATP synthase protein I
MKNRLLDFGRVIAKKQIKMAIFVTLAICVLFYSLAGIEQMQSALLAGFVAIIPNSIFAFKAFKYAGAQSSEKVIESFYQGEKIKMVLTAILFALSFKFFSVMPVPFFTTYCVVMVLPLLTGILFKL